MANINFKNSELGPIPNDWEVKALGEIADINPQSTQKLPNQFYYIDLESVVSGHLLNRQIVFSENAPSRAQRHFQQNDILYQTVRPYQKNNLFVNFDSFHFIASTGYAVIRFIKDISDAKYIYYLLHTDDFVSRVMDNCTGTSYPAINPNVLKSFLLPLPPLPEQRRIAAALSDIDALIDNLDALIDKKRLIKQATMQQLLSGKKKINGFNDKWVMKKLGDCCEVHNGYAFKSEKFCIVGNTIIRISDIDNSTVSMNETVKYPFEENIPNDFLVEMDDILIAMSGATTGKVGMYRDTQVAYINQRVGRFDIIDKEVLINEFLFHLLQTELFSTYLQSILVAGAQPNISSNQIENWIIPIPTLAEQTAISKILSDMDEEINLLEAKKEKYTHLKQGMMSELLSGRIRI